MPVPVQLADLDTSACGDMGWMFKDCRSLTSLDVSGFDTSACRDMEGMFRGCDALGLPEGARQFDFSASGQTVEDLT